MKKIITQGTIVMLIILSGCTKEVITGDSNIDVPVVEAFLEPGKNISVQLSKMIPFIEGGSTGSFNLESEELHIDYNGTDYLLSPVAGKPGEYRSSDTNLVAVTGGLYNLFFDYNGIKVTSTTSIPSPPTNIGLSSTILEVDPDVVGPNATVDPMIVSWDNPDNAYHVIIVEYMESIYDPISVNLSSDSFSKFKKIATEPILDNTYELNTRQHLVFFGTYSITIYKVQEEYVNLYENIGQSSLNLTEPLTNIINGLGIFTGINSDTLNLETIEI